MSNSRFMRSYIVGAAIGILSWVVYVVVNAPIGITTALSEVAGAAAVPLIGTEAVAANPYWAKTIPAWDYGTLFLVGTFVGALLSSISEKTFKWEFVPATWKDRFGDKVAPRFFAAFIGGAFVMFGARLAGGCTSGHGISGSLQLAVSSWTFFLVMFVTGILTARIFYSTSSKSTKEDL